jgi:hypothetical protein
MESARYLLGYKLHLIKSNKEVDLRKEGDGLKKE